MRIEILKIRLLPTGGRSLKAFADIKFDDWVVFDFRVIKQDGEKAYVNCPQVSWKDPETGQIKFKAVLSIPSEQKQLIDVAILSAFQKEVEKRNGDQRQ